MILGITGQCIDSCGRKRIAGAGKDVVANRLVDNHNFVSVAWADPLKRFCKEVYDFADDALWGESDLRILPDKRYPRPNGGYLSPRECLQSLGSNWGRNCYINTWVDYGIRVAKSILNGYGYTPQMGLFETHNDMNRNGVVFSDVRFLNEQKAVQDAGGKVVRVKRQMNTPYDEKAMNLLHNSETELANQPDDMFDYIIDNNGTLDELMVKVDNMFEEIRAWTIC